MPQLVTTVLLDGPPVAWHVKNGTDSMGQPFVVAETTDRTIGFSARDVRSLIYFAASLLNAVRMHADIAEITERDPIGL